MKRNPLLVATSILIALTVFSAIMPVFAAVHLLNKFPPYYAGETGYSTPNAYAYCNKNTGWVLARSKKDGWAYAHMVEKFTNTHGTIDYCRVDVVVSGQYKEKSQPWGSTCETKFRCQIWDLTTMTKIYEERKEFNKDQASYWFYCYSDLQNNHVYEVCVGVYVKTSWGWFWQYAVAELRCYVDQIVMTGWY